MPDSFTVTITEGAHLLKLKDLGQNMEMVTGILNDFIQPIRAYEEERFWDYAQGGGDWPELAPATVKRRRKSRAKGSLGPAGETAILIDTGGLVGALAPEATIGSSNDVNGFRLTIRINDAPHEGGGTFDQIAAWHHFGAGNLPARKVIGPLPDHVLDTLNAIVKNWIQRYAGSF